MVEERGMQIWLTVVIGMFVGYGLLLLVGWLMIELLSRTLSLSDFNVFKGDPELASFPGKSRRRGGA
jgi:hypothetical protein